MSVAGIDANDSPYEIANAVEMKSGLYALYAASSIVACEVRMRETLYAWPVLSNEPRETIGMYCAYQMFLYCGAGRGESGGEERGSKGDTHVEDGREEPVEEHQADAGVRSRPPGHGKPAIAAVSLRRTQGRRKKRHARAVVVRNVRPIERDEAHRETVLVPEKLVHFLLARRMGERPIPSDTKK